MPHSKPLIPLWIKLSYTLFMSILIPTYWLTYGPREFLWFCDIGLLLALPALWLEDSFLISTSALGVLICQSIWIIDFLGHPFGVHFFGASDYMFDPTYTLGIRAISLFHLWFPPLALWTLHRLGYDRRALLAQTILGITAMLICHACFIPPAPTVHSPLAVNENCVFGLGATAWTPIPRPAWFIAILIGIPTLFYLPTHRLLKRLFPSPLNP